MNAHTAPAPARRLPIVVEFAARAGGFVPEVSVALMLPAEAVTGAPSPEYLAEDVFEATNAPFEVRGTAALIRAEFARLLDQHGLRFPSLSVGDLVHVGGVTVRVDPVGFSRVA